jgi:hypothetical protein
VLRGSGVKGGIHHLGCSIDEFKKHIESQFVEGMSWDNQGKWHIDHIVAIKYRDGGNLPTVEEILARLHYTNTQPLWREDNLKKGNR